MVAIIAEPEGEATNLDAQVAERLYICIILYFSLYVYMSVTVSYGHLARGLKIVSAAIPMASSYSIYVYNVLNSRFRLLPILRCTCSGQFGGRLRQSVRHFLLNPRFTKDDTTQDASVDWSEPARALPSEVLRDFHHG